MGVLKKMDYTDALDHIERNKALFKLLYITKDMTAKKVAENQNIEYTPSFQRALFTVFGAKGKGHGGARPGSGNKKGVKLKKDE